MVCEACGKDFLGLRKNHLTCSRRCQVDRYYGKGEKCGREWDKTEVFTGLPCPKCKAWVAHNESENGGYCSINRWRICKPYMPGVKPYQPKEKK